MLTSVPLLEYRVPVLSVRNAEFDRRTWANFGERLAQTALDLVHGRQPLPRHTAVPGNCDRRQTLQSVKS